MNDVLIQGTVCAGKRRHRTGFSLRHDLRAWAGDGCSVGGCQAGAAASSAGKNRFIERLEQSGLAVTTQEEGRLALYRLFAGSIICPQAEMDGQALKADSDDRIWCWIQFAGLRLTASELICLEEQGTTPTPDLLGEHGRQELTEKSTLPEQSRKVLWSMKWNTLRRGTA